MSHEVILHSSDKGYSLSLNPKLATISHWKTAEGIDIFRPSPKQNPWPEGSAIPFYGCPLLFPFAGRVWEKTKGPGFWQSEDEGVFAMQPHGFAHTELSWEAESSTPSSVVLKTSSTPKTYKEYFPFHFELFLEILLKENRLEMNLRIHANVNNKSPMPVAPGWHCFFQATPQEQMENNLEIKLPSQCYHSVTTEGNAGQREIFPSDLQQGNGKHIRLNQTHYLTKNGIVGPLQTPSFLISSPSRPGLDCTWKMEDSTCDYFAVLWRKESEKDFFCVEPWTSLPDAPSRPSLTLVQAGQGTSFGMILKLTHRK